MLSTTNGVGMVTQCLGVPDPQVSRISGAWHFQARDPHFASVCEVGVGRVPEVKQLLACTSCLERSFILTGGRVKACVLLH